MVGVLLEQLFSLLLDLRQDPSARLNIKRNEDLNGAASGRHIGCSGCPGGDLELPAGVDTPGSRARIKDQTGLRLRSKDILASGNLAS